MYGVLHRSTVLWRKEEDPFMYSLVELATSLAS